MTSLMRAVVLSIISIWVGVAGILFIRALGGSDESAPGAAAYTSDVSFRLSSLADLLDQYSRFPAATDAGTPPWQADLRQYAINLSSTCQSVRDEHSAAPGDYRESERRLNEAMDKCLAAGVAIASAAEHDAPIELDIATRLLAEMNALIAQSTKLLPPAD